MAILGCARAAGAARATQAETKRARNVRVFIKEVLLELSGVANAKLEFASTGVVVTFSGDREGIIQTKRSYGEVESDTDAPAIVVEVLLRISKVEAVWIKVNVADVIKDREADALNHRHGVFHGAEPVGAAPKRFVVDINRSNFAVIKATQCVQAAAEITIKKRHLVGVAIGLRHTKTTEDFDHVARCKAWEVLSAADFKPVKVGFATKGAAGHLPDELEALSLVRKQDIIAGVVDDRAGDLGHEATTL